MRRQSLLVPCVSLDQFRRFRGPSGAACFVNCSDRGGQEQHHLRRGLPGPSQPSRRFFPQYCLLRTRGGSLPVAPAGTNMGRMTHAFFYGLSLNPCQNYETNPRPPIPVCPRRPDAAPLFCS
jgi:hypothetical protein